MRGHHGLTMMELGNTKDDDIRTTRVQRKDGGRTMLDHDLMRFALAGALGVYEQPEKPNDDDTLADPKIHLHPPDQKDQAEG